MSKLNSLKKNTFFSFVTQILNYITPFIIAPYISRVLLPEGIGIYSYAYSIVSYFQMIVVFGFSISAIKAISKERDNKEKYSSYFWNTLFIRLLFFVLCLLTYIILTCFGVFGKNIDVNIFWALSLVLIGDALDCGFLFQGLEKFKTVSIVNLVCNVIYLLAIFLFVKDKNDILLYTLLKSGLKVVISLVYMFLSWSLICKPKIEKSLLKEILIQSFIFFIPTLTMTISPSIDQTMLGTLSNNIEVGYYQQIHKIVNLVSALVYALSPVFLSRISYMMKNAENLSISKTIISALDFASFIVTPLFFGLFVIAKYFIPAYFGDEFINAIPVLYCFLPYTVLTPFASLIINSYYYPSGKVNQCTMFLIISILINFGLNIPMIRYFGAVGAAIASSISNIVLLVLLVLFSRKVIDYFAFLRLFWKKIISGSAMFLIILLLNLAISSFTNDRFIIL